MTDYVATLKSALADRYTIEQTLGAGGMAVVYLAHDQKHDRQVAIKVLRPELSAAIGGERFLEEIRIEASLQHPLIVPLYDSGEANGLLFYVMPYIEGETLAERLLRETQLPISDALNVVRDVGSALAYAHEHGVVHRDVKPENIFLSGQHAMVADFGIARALELTGGERLTSTGLAVGTPAYMSPEQATGSEDLDGRADIYSLGCVLHEMLTGTPPFTGSTPRAVVARHAQEKPPPIKTVRPTVPDWVEEAVQISLAKVPADRFPTVAEFIQTLETEGVGLQRAGEGRRRLSRRAMSAAVVTGLIALTAVATWRVVRMPAAQLDQHRVVVFAPEDNMRGQSDGGVGEAVAMAIGYALEGTRPLKWIEGDDWLAPDERVNRALVTPAVRRNVSTRQRAAYYIDGSIRREIDSVTIILRLWDVGGDSLVSRAASSAEVASASFAHLGVRAVSALLPALLGPGRRVDVTALAERDAAAIANWLQGETAYRSANFQAALDHFSRAVEQDSALALAAIGGSQAATWLLTTSPAGLKTLRLEEAEELIEAAIRYEQFLSPANSHFARGLWYYLTGQADFAISRLRLALEIEPQWSEAWMALGEVYQHLLPSMWSDSSAEVAFTKAMNVDAEFTPPLFHLAEFAIRRGDTRRAESLVERFRQTGQDSIFEMPHSLAIECLRTESGDMSWDGVVRRAPLLVLGAANQLARSVKPDCAVDAYTAVLNSEVSAVSERWGALLGLQSLLLAQGKYEDVRRILDSDVAAPLIGPALYLLDAAAGAPLDNRAAQVAREWGEDYGTMSSPRLWLYGIWAAHQDRSLQVRAIAAELVLRAESTNTRRDVLFADIMSAHSALIVGNSHEALRRFRELALTARRPDLAWNPWESLAAERLALAKLLLELGEYEEAHAVASLLEHPQPIIYLAYLPASLSVRLQAAEAMGKTDLAAQYRLRLSELRSEPVM